MPYALISDIHANLPALEAVLADIESRGLLGSTFHLGDLVGYAPWPNATVERLRAAGISGVSGNYDSTVAMRYDHCGCQYTDPHEQDLSHQSFAWTLEQVSDVSRSHLAALPFRLDLTPGGGHRGGPRLTLVHGTPTLNTLYWTEDRPDAFCLKMAHHAGLRRGDVIAFGHTHQPWSREVDGFHFINTGSVGRPKDGDWRAGYVILDLEGAAPRAELVRVAYDLDEARRGILASSLPDEFADYLAAGGRPVRAVSKGENGRRWWSTGPAAPLGLPLNQARPQHILTGYVIRNFQSRRPAVSGRDRALGAGAADGCRAR